MRAEGHAGRELQSVAPEQGSPHLRPDPADQRLPRVLGQGVPHGVGAARGHLGQLLVGDLGHGRPAAAGRGQRGPGDVLAARRHGERQVDGVLAAHPGGALGDGAQGDDGVQVRHAVGGRQGHGAQPQDDGHPVSEPGRLQHGDPLGEHRGAGAPCLRHDVQAHPRVGDATGAGGQLLEVPHSAVVDEAEDWCGGGVLGHASIVPGPSRPGPPRRRGVHPRRRSRSCRNAIPVPAPVAHRAVRPRPRRTPPTCCAGSWS